MQEFITQIIVSFFVSGIAVTLVSMLAERMNEKIAGVIMMFPTTAALGFFFLSLSTSPAHVAAVVPAALIPLSIVALSAYIYIRFANYLRHYFSGKIIGIFLSLICTSLVWLIIVIPFVWLKFSSLKAGIIGYFAITSVAVWLFATAKSEVVHQKHTYSKKAIILRAFFVGTVISTVVIIGKLINPFLGSVATMYPAATMATLLIFNFYYQPTQLYHFFRQAPLGSLSIFTYCLSIMWLYPRVGLAVGTIMAYLIVQWCAFYLSPWLMGKWTN